MLSTAIQWKLQVYLKTLRVWTLLRIIIYVTCEVITYMPQTIRGPTRLERCGPDGILADGYRPKG